MPSDPQEDLARLERQMADLQAEVRGWTAHLAGVAGAMARLERLEGAGEEPEAREPGYEFAPQMRWHELDEDGRAEVVTRIREWVDTVYREQFPRAADIAPCWEAHPVCVVLLDVLSEMHGALYHGTKRGWGVVHNQAELYVRFGREITALLQAELAECKYGQHATHRPTPGGGRRG